MQVKHEIQLIESITLKPDHFSFSNSQTTSSESIPTLDTYTISQSKLNSINYIASCPIGNLVAVYLNNSQQIVLIDTKTYLKLERFPLKPCDKQFSKQSFTLKGIDFSPDGLKLAIGQSDCIIYIYKLANYMNQIGETTISPNINPSGVQIGSIGPQTGPLTSSSSTTTTTVTTTKTTTKPTITGKFVCTSPVSCLIWTECGIIFGTQDGKIKLISITGGARSSSLSQTTTTTTNDNQLLAHANNTAGSQSSSSSSSKVITIYNSPKGFMPISLAFKYPIVLIGFINNDIIFVTLAGVGADSIVNNNNNPSSSTSQMVLQPEAVQPFVNRRGSSQPATISAAQIGSIKHSCPPYYLSIIQNSTILSSGADGRIVLHSLVNNNNQSNNNLSINWLQNIDLKEDVLACDYSNINEIVAIATKNRLLFLKNDLESNSWQLQTSFIELKQTFSITTIRWLKDGSQLVLGTLNGSVELFQCSWNKQASIGEQLEICHIAKNRVRITDRARNLLATYKSQYDIKRVNLLDNGQSVIIWTTNSLLLANLNCSLQSEIQWNQNKNQKSAKFSFKHLGYVLLFNQVTKELSIIKLGKDSILYTINYHQENRININRKLICVRQYPSNNQKSTTIITNNVQQPNQRHSITTNLDASLSPVRQLSASSVPKNNRSRQPSLINQQEDQVSSSANLNNLDDFGRSVINERLAYVIESNTLLIIVDLKTNSTEFSQKYVEQIEYLELSNTTNYLIFKFKNNQLNLLSMSPLTSTTSSGNDNNRNIKDKHQQQQKVLLEKCEYAKWLPNSDILVAQSQYNIFIWYNVEDLNEVTTIDTRSFNVTNTAPILDLSLISISNNNSIGNKQKVLKNIFKKGKPYPTMTRLTSDSILLSNLQTIPFDKVKVKFYTELAKGKLESALEVLLTTNKYIPERMKNSLLTKLGWLAINKADCEIAIRAFRELGHISMVKCLEKCLNSIDGEECEWRLAMLKGDWDTFEQVAKAEHIIETYKRLNKWSKLIAYLNKTQQFRQRDLVEQEYRDWLIERGRVIEASEMLVKASDLAGAIELLINNEKYESATELFIREQRVPLLQTNNHDDNNNNNVKIRNHFDNSLIELAKKFKTKLIDINDFNNAAKVCDKILGQFDEALQFYIKANNFQDALIMAKLNCNSIEKGEEKISNIEELFGNYLINQFGENKLSRKKALPAINHLLNAKQYYKAFEVAIIELKDVQQAYDILVSYSVQIGATDKQADNKIKEYSKLIVDFMLENERFDEAINVHLICENYQKVIELCLKQGDYKRAFDVALNYIYNNNKKETIDYFTSLAKGLISDLNNSELNDHLVEQAEKIYLILDKPELAIELNRNVQKYDRMLELIEQYQPDTLENNLLLLARQMEAGGKFSEAEKYLLKASDSEWTNVVRMYRLANKWPDAYRVAKDHCSSEKDPLLVQLAYWWSKSVFQNETEDGLAKAQNLLKRLNVFNLVIEFCCDNKNYQFAIDLCSLQNKKQEEEEEEENSDLLKYLEGKQKDIIKRYAQYLEEMHKFQQAEEMLVKYNQINEAVNMYLDNDLYQDAIRVVENQLNKLESESNLITETNNTKQQKELVDLLNSTLIKCANRVAEEAKVPKRQQQILQPSTNSLLNVSGKSLEKLQKAQQLYLRAQKPELAVSMYRERGMWQEAIQVAQRFAPQLLESVENALDNQVLDDLSPIVAQVNQQQQHQNQSRSSSSSRSSLLSYQSGSQNEVSYHQEKARQHGLVNSGSGGSGSSTARQSAASYLQSKAELSIKNGDLTATKSALNKFMVNLVEGGSENETVVDNVNIWLEQLERSTASLSINKMNYKEIVKIIDRIMINSSWGFKQFGMNNNDFLKVWRNLRDILLPVYLNILSMEEGDTDESISQEVERRLLISHYISLHYVLLDKLYSNLEQKKQQQQQPLAYSSSSRQARRQSSGSALLNDMVGANGPIWPVSLTPLQADRLREVVSMAANKGESCNDILSLIAKLSLSLLRYTDLIESKLAFHVAGFWLVVANRQDLARFVWTRLIELVEEQQDDNYDTTKNTNAVSSLEFELQRAGIPTQSNSLTNGDDNMKQKAKKGFKDGGKIFNYKISISVLNEIRQWLVETLLESSSKLSLDERGQLECSLADFPTPRPPCLVSGYPVFKGSNELLLNKGRHSKKLFSVRLSEWNCLVAMLHHSEQKKKANSSSILFMDRKKNNTITSQRAAEVQDVIDFIVRLTGSDPSSIIP